MRQPRGFGDTATVQEAYDLLTMPEPNTGCWLWLAGGGGIDGYGAISWRGKTIPAHRWSYRVSKGPIPRGMLVCHKCDVRYCVNPAHLWLGTYHQNTKDMLGKGRHRTSPVVGEKHHKAKLTEVNVKAILRDGRTHDTISREMGVTRGMVSHIKRGIAWKHIKRDTDAL